MNQEPYYSTTDLSIASAIISSGYGLNQIQKEGNKARFFFEASHGLSQFMENFILDKVLVNPKKHFYVIKDLKNTLHNLP